MPNQIHRRILLAAVLALAPCTAPAASQAPVAAEHGMVVTAQHLASRGGVDVLGRGGNAVDAAVAVGYALSVVYPAAGNLGGGGFLTIELADGRKTFLDFREMAPKAATANMYLDKDGNVIKGLSTKGHLAVGVPGSVHGMEYARENYGTMKRADLIAPALQLAEDGFALEQGDIDLLLTATSDFAEDPASAAIFLNNGKPYQVGEKLVQHELAETLREISKRGTDGFYKGWVADAIVASSQAGKGLLTLAALDSYKTRELKPAECDYRGYHVVSAPPPSSGGVIICEILNVLEGYPLKELGYHSADAMHVQIEAMRHAYVDRNSYLGDPDFVKNPLDRLLDKNYAAKIRAVIDPKQAAVSKDIKPGVEPHEGSNTTHYSIADKDGNALAVPSTPNHWFGARVTTRGGQAGGGGGPPGREPHHHGRAPDDDQRHRLRHERAGSRRYAALPPAVAPGPDQSGELPAFAGPPKDPGGQGPQVRFAATGQPPGGNHHRRTVADGQAGRQQSLLRGERPAPQHRAGCRLPIVIARSHKVASAGASHRDASAADDATSSTQAGCGRPNMPESYSWVPIHAISSS